MNKGNDDFAGGEELPESFEPSKYDVIVGWARQNYHHGKEKTIVALISVGWRSSAGSH
jgi:hypothetical protein